MYGESESVENVLHWRTLFDVEGTELGSVRRVFEESYDRLLGSCYNLFPPEEQVRKLLAARLPLIPFLSEADVRDLHFTIRRSGGKVRASTPLRDCLVRVCQDLRLDHMHTQDMKAAILENP